MSVPRLSRLEMKVMDDLWEHGPSAIREIQERLPGRKRPAYSTVQTIVYRLEQKGAVRRTRKIGNAHIFEPLVSRSAASNHLLDDVLSMFGGRAQPLIAQLIETGRLTQEDLDEARQTLDRLKRSRASVSGRRSREQAR